MSDNHALVFEEHEQQRRVEALGRYLEVTEELLEAAVDEDWDSFILKEALRDEIFMTLHLSDGQQFSEPYRLEALKIASEIELNQEAISVAVKQRMTKLEGMVRTNKQANKMEHAYAQAEGLSTDPFGHIV